MVKIAPSVMCANFLNLEKDITSLNKAGTEILHIDIMDGHFVPNLCLNFDIIKLLKMSSNALLDVHLMVDDPENYIPKLGELGVDYVSFHIETEKYPIRLIRKIKKAGMKAGIAVNPSTGIDPLTYIMNEADFILIMTVEPGFAGQRFIPEIFAKISDIKKLIIERELNILIEVDGNISEETGKRCVESGADILVGGTSSIFKKDKDLCDAFIEFNNKMNNGSLTSSTVNF